MPVEPAAHPRLLRRFVVVSALGTLGLSSACIWSPSSREEAERDANASAMSVSGAAPSPGATVTLRARDHVLGQDVPLLAVQASTEEISPGSGLYGWSASIDVSALSFWVPPDVGAMSQGTTPNGRLELSAVLDDDTLLPTFTKKASECAGAHYDQNQDMIGAIVACADGTSVVQFENTGVEQDPEPATWNLVQPWTPDDNREWALVEYASQGLQIYGLVCRPLGDEPRPVHIFNHGGTEGLTQFDLDLCKTWASLGWITAMSAYRGESVQIGSVMPYQSEGQVELCMGEVTDVMRLQEIVHAQIPTARRDRVLMTGLSHGGCITTRAVERGAKVQAAADVFGPADWALMHERWEEDWVDFLGGGPIELAVGGTPVERPMGYRWRSPAYHEPDNPMFAGDLAGRNDVKFVIFQGTEDYVVRAEQSCRLAESAWGENSERWYKDLAGAPIDDAVEGCTQSWGDPDSLVYPDPDGNWEGNRFLMMYQQLGHGLTGAMFDDYVGFIEGLGWT